MAKKNELTLLLQEYRATIEDSGSLSIDATYEVDGIEENTEVPIEFQMIVEAGKHKYDSSPSVVRVLSQDQNSFYASAYFDCDPDQLPDKFQIFYRLFGSKKSFVVEPNIATKKAVEVCRFLKKYFRGKQMGRFEFQSEFCLCKK